jgi:hypothetical protein
LRGEKLCADVAAPAVCGGGGDDSHKNQPAGFAGSAGGGMTEIMGIISGALVEEYDFLDAVHRGDIERIRVMLENDISEYLVQFCKELLKN